MFFSQKESSSRTPPTDLFARFVRVFCNSSRKNLPLVGLIHRLLMRATYNAHWIIVLEDLQKEKMGDMYFRKAKCATY